MQMISAHHCKWQECSDAGTGFVRVQGKSGKKEGSWVVDIEGKRICWSLEVTKIVGRSPLGKKRLQRQGGDWERKGKSS